MGVRTRSVTIDYRPCDGHRNVEWHHAAATVSAPRAAGLSGDTHWWSDDTASASAISTSRASSQRGCDGDMVHERRS
jgi:hypothetical protein